MIVHYLESSAWAKLYLAEPGSAWMRSWLETEHQVMTSPLGLVEVLAANARARRRGGIATKQMRTFDARIRSDFFKMSVVGFDEAVFQTAIELPGRYGLRGADAVHLASAMAIREELSSDSVSLVSSDGELLQAADLAGFDTIDPVVHERSEV